jgi:hypothetical protein
MSESFDQEIQWRVGELNAAHNRRNAEASKVKCLSCQYEYKEKKLGRAMTEQERAHWSMWGCTCNPEEEVMD